MMFSKIFVAALLSTSSAAVLSTASGSSRGMLKVQETLVKSLLDTKKSKGLTPEQQQIAEEVKSLILDGTMPDIMSAHEADKRLIDEHVAAFDACAAEFQENEGMVERLCSALSSAKGISDTCFADKVELDNTLAAETDDLQSYLEMQTPPSPTVPSDHMGMDVEMFIVELNQYFSSFNATYKEKKAHKKDANATCMAKSQECTTKYADYNGAYCEMFTSYESVKSADGACYALAWKLYEETWTSALDNAESRKTDYKACGKLLCLIDVLLEEDAASAAQKVASCEDSSNSFPQLDLTEPQLPLKDDTEALDKLKATVEAYVDFKVECDDSLYEGESIYDESPYDESPYDESPYGESPYDESPY